jgi:hypothetical protein
MLFEEVAGKRILMYESKLRFNIPMKFHKVGMAIKNVFVGSEKYLPLCWAGMIGVRNSG